MITIVTGTDTGVGKTIVTAALAARASATGQSVAVLKPAQTGTAAFAPGETSDMETVARLAGPDVTTLTLVSFPDPLSPHAAAQVAGAPELYLGDVLEAVAKLAATHDLVLIEGAGGVLVPMGYGALDHRGRGSRAAGAGRRGGPRRSGHPQPHRADD